MFQSRFVLINFLNLVIIYNFKVEKSNGNQNGQLPPAFSPPIRNQNLVSSSIPNQPSEKPIVSAPAPPPPPPSAPRQQLPPMNTDESMFKTSNGPTVVSPSQSRSNMVSPATVRSNMASPTAVRMSPTSQMLQRQLSQLKKSEERPERREEDIPPATPQTLRRNNSYVQPQLRSRLGSHTPSYNELQFKYGPNKGPSPISDRDYQKEARNTVVGELAR